MKIQKIHHVAYRCNDAKETVDFYTSVMDMSLVLAISEDKVPSTKEPDPYMHVFMDAGMGNVLAFFELPNSPAMSKDLNTPDWVQHITFEVEDLEALTAARIQIEKAGVSVIGPVNHGIFKSIYFFDPNGHRLELAANTGTAEMMDKLHDVAPLMVEEWSRTKKAPDHAAWLHSDEFGD